jgi:hypothetical protein
MNRAAVSKDTAAFFFKEEQKQGWENGYQET